jgi:hypothetical protein
LKPELVVFKLFDVLKLPILCFPLFSLFSVFPRFSLLTLFLFIIQLFGVVLRGCREDLLGDLGEVGGYAMAGGGLKIPHALRVHS